MMNAPPDWPMLVASQEPVVALAFATGNFPQMVRHVQPLLQASKLAEMRPLPGRPIPVPALLAWANEQTTYPQILLALGGLRLARQFDAAEKLLSTHRPDVPAEWQPALANEEAALAWHAGRHDEAVKMWRGQADSIPVLFNRGMAALFSGKPTDARKSLNAAIAKLSEDSGWYHLGQLYLAVAQMRG
jgi:hypothetical protein